MTPLIDFQIYHHEMQFYLFQKLTNAFFLINEKIPGTYITFALNLEAISWNFPLS